MTIIHQNYKRLRNYWEPVFAPSTDVGGFQEFTWDTKHAPAFKMGVCAAHILKKLAEEKQRYTLNDLTFDTCDFVGDFGFTRLTFKSCKFTNCDFQDSKWNGTKFSKCQFNKTSISTAHFNEVDFIDCNWRDTGVSSGEMTFTNISMNNPGDFISSIYTNLNEAVLSQNGTTVIYQKFRLEGTKAKIARMLLNNLHSSPDDDSYYEGVKTYTIQNLTAKIMKIDYDKFSEFWFKKILFFFIKKGLQIELNVLQISGWVNAWGGSIGRPFTVGIGLICTFFVFYQFLFEIKGHALLAAFEITLLFGYTKYASVADDLLLQVFYALNGVFGLWWYAIFIPTVVNRVNRIRI